MKKALLLAALLALPVHPLTAQYAAAPAAPTSAAKAAAKPKPAIYFDATTFDARAFLPPPPSDKSNETLHELEGILQAQSVRTPEQVARIKSEEHYNVFVFSNVVPWLNQQSIDQLPLATALLGRVMETAKPIVVASKNVYNRPRPRLLNSRVFPAIENPKDPAYPSGHSTRATLDALVLAQLSPGNTMAIQKRGAQVGDDRVIAGVHYPSDVTAGRRMAQAIFNRMMSQPDFRDELKAAKAEVADYERKNAR